MTASLVASDAPFGQALRRGGESARSWLRAFAGDDPP
jgi:hypothetical protein